MEFNVFSFPFEQIGWCLRQLSLSGSMGNVIAIILYLVIGAIPVVAFLLLKKERKNCKVDFLLLFLSVLLYIMMYYMINPGLMVSTVAGSGRMLWGSTFYSVLLTYFVMRLLGTNKRVDIKSLHKCLYIVLVVVLLMFAGSVLVEMFVNLPADCTELTERNTGVTSQADLTLSYVALALQSIVSALPNALSAVAVFFSIKVIRELLKDVYSEMAVTWVKKIGVFCKRSLVVVVVVIMTVNVLQLMLAAYIYDIHILVSIPVFAILFLLVIHVMAKYMEENQRLKQDNDLFI